MESRGDVGYTYAKKSHECKQNKKQAGAELCQARVDKVQFMFLRRKYQSKY